MNQQPPLFPFGKFVSPGDYDEMIRGSLIDAIESFPGELHAATFWDIRKSTRYHIPQLDDSPNRASFG